MVPSCESQGGIHSLALRARIQVDAVIVSQRPRPDEFFTPGSPLRSRAASVGSPTVRRWVVVVAMTDSSFSGGMASGHGRLAVPGVRGSRGCGRATASGANGAVQRAVRCTVLW